MSDQSSNPTAAGFLADLSGDTRRAIEAFEEARRQSPDAPEPAMNLLALYRDAGRAAEGEALSAEILARWSDDRDALAVVASFYLVIDRAERALELIEGSACVDALGKRPHTVYQQVLLANGRYDEALAQAERGRQTLLGRLRSTLTRAIALSHLGRHDAAAADFESLWRDEFGQGDPLRAGLVAEHARALVRAGQHDLARDVVARALRGAPDHPELLSLTSELEQQRAD